MESRVREFTDMMGRKVILSNCPQRIISVVPSQTELLFDLGLENEVVGITKFCIHPRQWFQNKERIGGTKNLNLEKIVLLKPDLIIANKEENTKEDIDFLAQHFPVWISDIKTVEDAVEMIRRVGEMVNRQDAADNLADQIISGFAHLNLRKEPKKIAYFIWKNPWMTVGKDTFINDIILKMGWQNIYANKDRYPATTLEELKLLNPEIILLSSEPYPFNKEHILEIKAQIPQAKVILVDGEMFSWYGSRMNKAPSYLNALLQQV